MTAYLPRRAVVVLTAVLLGFTQAGVRCGDHFFPDGRTATVVTR